MAFSDKAGMVDPKSQMHQRSVEEMMITDVYRVHPEMKLFEVVEVLIKHEISGAPVVDSLDRVLSVIGEGATLRLAASEGLDATIAHCLPKLTPANQIITVEKTATFTDAYRLFLKHSIHRIPVIDSARKLHGLISRSTILELFIEAHYGKKIVRHRVR